MTREPPTTLNYFIAPPARRARSIAWVVCVTTLLAGTTTWLFALRGFRILQNDAALICGWTALGVVSVMVAVLLGTTPPDAIRLPTRSSWWIIVLGAGALQLCALVTSAPALSEDPVRYRLDGRMWLEGVSPYAASPSTFFVKSKRADVVDGTVTHPHLRTIYPPTAQTVFVAARVVENAWSPVDLNWSHSTITWRDDICYFFPPFARAFVLRALFAAAAVAVAVALGSLLVNINRSVWWAMLVAWHPLFVIETAGMGHVDVVGVLFVLLTIRALQSRRPILATAMLALAAGVKPHVVLLAPFLLRDAIAAGARVPLKWLPVSFVSFLALVYSPMLYQQGYKGWLKTSHVYATSWEANGSVYDLIKASADENDGVSVQHAKDRARMLAAAAVVLTMLVAWFARADLPTAGYWVFLVALLFSPVVYPWYLLWVLCFVPLLRGWQGLTALVWAATVGVSYLLWRTSDWVLPTRWLLVEYVPVYATLMLEVVWLVRNRLEQGGLKPTVSAQLS